MKKIYLVLISLGLSLILFGCQDIVSSETRRSAFSSMNTSINVQIENISQDDFNLHLDKIKEIFNEYHKLTDNFQGYQGLNNIYTINNIAKNTISVDEIVQIDKKLYDILDLALAVNEETNGYFNISLGAIIDVWKELISNYLESGELVTQEVINQTQQRVDQIVIPEDPFSVFIENDLYYIKIKKSVVLDLGAIAKGYATQVAYEYLLSQNITGFMISGGSSSIALGSKTSNEGYYRIALVNPTNVFESYGVVSVKNTTITTSGSYNQYISDEDGNWYHHIISPVTKMPVNNYYTITLIGENAGLMDAYSTALFSMDLSTIEAFITSKDLEAFIYTNSGEIIRINAKSPFEER